jgi:diacylglycerol kinase family enzyme
VQRLPVDALLVELDGRPLLAVAHVVAMRSWWLGGVLAVMNCDHVGTWDMAPRAHPNDGRFDVVELTSTMRLRDRYQARTRVVHGTHVPHPDIAVRTATEGSWAWRRPMPVRVDGVVQGSVSELVVRIAPDHFAIHV